MSDIAAPELHDEIEALRAERDALLNAARLARRALGELRGGPHEEPAILRELCLAIAWAESGTSAPDSVRGYRCGRTVASEYGPRTCSRPIRRPGSCRRRDHLPEATP